MEGSDVVGNLEGPKCGCTVGLTLGEIEGLAEVGTSVGITVGSWLGKFVGIVLGKFVGITLGIDVGSSVTNFEDTAHRKIFRIFIPIM